MAKNKKKNHRKDDNNREREGRNFEVKKSVRKFAEASFKSFKKKNKDFYDSKKELRNGYIITLIDYLPDVIEFIVKYSHIDNNDVREAKHGVLEKLSNPEFIKVLKKELKNDNDIENIKFYPIIIGMMIKEAARINSIALEENPNAQTYDTSDLTDLSKMILKKKIKKFVKNDISEDIALDVLSVIPCREILNTSPSFRIRMFYETIYAIAMKKEVQFGKILDILVNEEDYPLFITFALLERKEKFTKLTDLQKKVYMDISTWCFVQMEDKLKKDDVKNIIKYYVKTRQNDDVHNKDSNRRYHLSSLPESDYPKLKAIIDEMIARDDSIKKYL